MQQLGRIRGQKYFPTNWSVFKFAQILDQAKELVVLQKLTDTNSHPFQPECQRSEIMGVVVLQHLEIHIFLISVVELLGNAMGWAQNMQV